MIVRARVIAPMAGPPIENGAVVTAGDRIVGLGSFTEISAHHSGEVLDLGDRVLVPGLINAHCHLDYTCLRGSIPSPKSFAAWIRAINAAKAELSPADYLSSLRDGFMEAKGFGTTTIVNVTGFPELIPRIDAPINTWWLAELMESSGQSPRSATIDPGTAPTD